MRTVTLDRRASARFRCAVTGLPRTDGWFAIRSRFAATSYADTPPSTISTRLRDAEAVSRAPAPGTFRRAGVKTDADAARYDTQITGLRSNVGYDVRGYGFDGRAPDGVLLVTRGPGHASHLDSGGALESTWPGYGQRPRPGEGAEDVRG